MASCKKCGKAIKWQQMNNKWVPLEPNSDAVVLKHNDVCPSKNQPLPVFKPKFAINDIIIYTIPKVKHRLRFQVKGIDLANKNYDLAPERFDNNDKPYFWAKNLRTKGIALVDTYSHVETELDDLLYTSEQQSIHIYAQNDFLEEELPF